MSYLFWYMVICYIAAWCAVHVDPMKHDGGASLIKDGEFDRESIEAAFKIALVPILNLYPIFLYIALSIKPMKKNILLRIKKMIEECENE